MSTVSHLTSAIDYSQQLFSNCGIEDIPVAAFQKYIDQSSGIGCHVNSDELDLTIFNNFTIDFQFLSDVYKSVDEHFSRESVSVDGDNNSPTLNSLGNMTIKRVVTAALFTVRNTTDFNLGLLSARILLRLCSMPGASACGIVNSNVLAAISSLMNKSATHEIQCKPTVEARATSESKMKGRAKQVKKDDDSDQEESNESEEVFDIDTTEPNEFAHMKSQMLFSQTDFFDEGELRPAVEYTRVSYLSLKLTLQDISRCLLSLFSSRSEEHVLDGISDSLTSILYLSKQRSNFANLSSMCCEQLRILCLSSNEVAMLSVLRSIQPALTMTGHDLRLPDGLKFRSACHNGAVEVILNVIEVWQDNAQLAVEVHALQMKSQPEVALHSVNDSIEEINSSEPTLSMALKIVLGCLQRITISPAIDKASFRGLFLNSISDILDKFSTANSCSELYGSIPTTSFGVMMRHYLTFLFKLSKSVKITHRAFSVEVCSIILSKDWIWSMSAATVSEFSYPMLLLCTLLKRCNDVAPTVRLRSISVIHDMLMKLEKDATASNNFTSGLQQAPSQLAECLLQLALGFKFSSMVSSGLGKSSHPTSRVSLDTSISTSTSSNPVSEDEFVNLLETLRSRTADEKPLVRAKAIQAYGFALALSWPRQSSFGGDLNASTVSVEHVNMLVTEDDINIFIDATSDMASLTTRKQALLSLSALVQSRPTDVLLQEAWVMSCLPLVTDSETSIQNKVAQMTYEMLFENLLKWSNNLASGIVSSPGISIVWQICSKISNSGRLKLLRSAVGYMVKYGYLIVSPSQPSHSHAHSCKLLEILKVIKEVCCAGISRQQALPSQTTMPIGSLRDDDPDIISKAGWILLESVLGHENVISSTIDAKNPSNDISATFVIECFFLKQKNRFGNNRASSILDSDDIRMLVVLEKLAVNVSIPDAKKVLKEVKFLLVQMEQSTEAISACVSVSMAMMKIIFSASLPSFHQEIYAWSSSLVAIIYHILTSIVFGEEVATASTMVNEIPSCIKRALDASAVSFLTATDSNTKIIDGAVKAIISNCLFLLGELSMLGFSIEEDENNFLDYQGIKEQVAVGVSNFIDYKVSRTSSHGFKLSLPSEVLEVVQLLLAANLPSTQAGFDKEKDSNEVTRICPVVVRAHAFVTMGKFCLRSQKLAREHVNIFLRELHHESSSREVDESAYQSPQMDNTSAIRSNALLVLGDLCIKYTNLVDRNIDAMASCLQDKDVLVRRHAFVLLTQLLLQDYLKWRGMLLFRFLATAVDKDPEFAEFSRLVLKRTMHTKYPEFFCQHFAEAVIVFNECEDHPIYASVAAAGSDGGSIAVTMVGVHLHGKQCRNRRLKLYAFMMEDLSEEQRIQVTAKLAQDILANALDPNLFKANSSRSTTTVAFEEVLEDTLLILQSPLLKVGSSAGGKTGSSNIASMADDLMLDEELAASSQVAGATAAVTALAATKARSKVLKTLSKQHLVNHVLPVITSLKNVLETVRSPVQGALMDYLLYLMKHNKSEVEETFNNDPTLKAEIEYDLKVYERNKALKEQQKAIELAQQHLERTLAKSTGSKSGRKSVDTHLKRLSLSSKQLYSNDAARSPYDMIGMLASGQASTSGLKSVLKNSGVSGSSGKLPFNPSSVLQPIPMTAGSLRSRSTTSSKRASFADDDFADRMIPFADDGLENFKYDVDGCHDSDPSTSDGSRFSKQRRWSVSTNTLHSSEQLQDDSENFPVWKKSNNANNGDQEDDEVAPPVKKRDKSSRFSATDMVVEEFIDGELREDSGSGAEVSKSLLETFAQAKNTDMASFSTHQSKSKSMTGSRFNSGRKGADSLAMLSTKM